MMGKTIQIELQENNIKTDVYIKYDQKVAGIVSEIYQNLNQNIEKPTSNYPKPHPTSIKINGKIDSTTVLLEVKDNSLQLSYMRNPNKGLVQDKEEFSFREINQITLKKGFFSSATLELITFSGKIKIKNVDNTIGNQFISIFKYKKAEAIRKQEQKKLKTENKINLRKTGNLLYIESFVNRFKENYNIKDINKLNNLLESKGINITNQELTDIVKEEVKKQQYKDFKEKITYNNPLTLEQYIRNFMEIYGENYTKLNTIFRKLLQEKNITFSEEEIINIILQIKKEREISNFEEELLSTVNSGSSPFVTINDVDLLDGYQFEGLLKILFEKMGYRVEHTPLSGDQGADLILTRFDDRIVVQAKCYSDKVSNKAVQEVVASISMYNASKGMVVTNNEFTNSAVELANSNNVELIGRFKLDSLIKQFPINKNQF